MTDRPNPFAVLPSLDAMLRSAALADEVEAHGRPLVTEGLRAVIAELRQNPKDLPETTEAAIALKEELILALALAAAALHQ